VGKFFVVVEREGDREEKGKVETIPG